MGKHPKHLWESVNLESKVSISKPNLASTKKRTRSAALAQSSMAGVESDVYSRRVIRRDLEVRVVIGPRGAERLWLV